MKALDHIASAFLRRILRRMKELGVNQSELAKRMKVSKPYITKVLRQDVRMMSAKCWLTGIGKGNADEVENT